jgi:uncharacterized OB-fold protein
MNTTAPAHYWRQNKTWKKWLGRRGKVIASTVIRVAADPQSAFTPYSLALIDFKGEKKMCMGAGNEVFAPGETVRCVLRKLAQPNPTEVIPYGIKVTKDFS